MRPPFTIMVTIPESQGKDSAPFEWAILGPQGGVIHSGSYEGNKGAQEAFLQAVEYASFKL